jgi:ABC-type branched-subunit amino acid transport system substrate-binding protein
VPRPYAVNVVKHAYGGGFGSAFSYHFLDFSEWQAAELPDGASVWTSLPFVASDDNPAVTDFVARARRHSRGDLVTHVAFTHYNAIQVLKLGMEKAGSTAGDKVMAAMDGLQLSTATGRISISGGYAAMPMYVARAVRGKLDVVRKFDAVAAGVTCS